MSTLPKIPRDEARTVRKLLGTVIGIGGVAFGITCLFLSMRAVMDIGGSCASGGPYVVGQQCPSGVGWLTPVSIFIALICAAVYLAANFDGGPDLTGLFWSALFVPLGWNFLEYGFTRGDVNWGWVICGLVFWAMGLPPLVLQLKREHLVRMLWGGRPGKPTTPRQKARQLAPILPKRYRAPAPARAAARPDRPASRPAPAPAPAAPPPPDAGGDVVARLERLAGLRATGALDADEYERAKERVLRGDP